MREFQTAIIGAGAAGLTAAISSKTMGSDTVICERLTKIGKKILASGNGRCNLSNDDLSESHYNPASRSLVRSVLDRCGKTAIDSFFDELGLETYSEEGRIFPRTNQSSSVLKVLEIKLKSLSIPVETDFEVDRIEYSEKSFAVVSKSGKKIIARKVVITGGGMSYPALGSNGSAYKLATGLGHTIIKPVPAAVALVVKDRLCHILQGQRIRAKVKAVISGKVAAESDGDLLFTKYGLSGTAILDVSREISVAINRDGDRDVSVCIDMAPFISEEDLAGKLESRIRKGCSPEDALSGILPLKIAAIIGASGKSSGGKKEMASEVKSKSFAISGTMGWNEAEFTAGGVDCNEVNPLTLESRLKKGIYLAGEILDVDGDRGGYNLAWAWASGSVAGKAGHE